MGLLFDGFWYMLEMFGIPLILNSTKIASLDLIKHAAYLLFLAPDLCLRADRSQWMVLLKLETTHQLPTDPEKVRNIYYEIPLTSLKWHMWDLRLSVWYFLGRHLIHIRSGAPIESIFSTCYIYRSVRQDSILAGQLRYESHEYHWLISDHGSYGSLEYCSAEGVSS